MSDSTTSATAIPAVRSNASSTRSGSMARRAACRYSSRRCADVQLPDIRTSSSVSAPMDLLREFRTVVVRRIAIDRMNVIDAALLWGVFDDERRALDTEVGGTAIGSGPAPGEVGIRRLRADLRHARLRKRVVHDADPLSHEFPQHRLVRRGQRRGANPLGLDRFSVLPRTEDQI